MASTANRLLLDIQDLAPDIAARAAEIEAARDIPSDLVEALRSIGTYRMFVPHSHGWSAPRFTGHAGYWA
jgi:indole-3-acetate monooxygenase